MVSKHDLVGALEKLEQELRSTDRSGTADFFRRMISSVMAVDNPVKLKELLSQLCSSGTIAQYADFSLKEELLFAAIYDEAEKLLSKL